MVQKTILAIAALMSIALAAGTFSCCLNCPNPPKGGEPAYTPAAPEPEEMTASEYSTSDSEPSSQPSGEVVDGVRIIKMTAEKYKFDPSVITVNEGDKVRLEITSKDVTHGFALKEYKINRKLEPGKTEVIEFTASRAGTFGFRCSEFCGLGHFGMKGKLVVQTK